MSTGVLDWMNGMNYWLLLKSEWQNEKKQFRVGRDLSQMVTIDRRVVWTSPRWS